MIEEYQEIIAKIENFITTSDDPAKVGAMEALASGTSSNVGYIKYLQDAKDILVTAKSNKAAFQVCVGTSTVSTPNYSPQNHLMLPKIQYERFDGSDITKFELFWSRLQPIHNNPAVSQEDKLNILLGYLDGEAKKLLSSLTISAVNYPVAVKTLKDTYGDKKEIVKQLYNQFDEIQCFGETVAEARLCLNQAELILNQLVGLGEDVNQSSIQAKWEKRVIPDWLYEACLMKISKHETFTVFRKQADESLKIKEAVFARNKEQSSTFCNVAKDYGAGKSRKFKKSHDQRKHDDKTDVRRNDKKNDNRYEKKNSTTSGGKKNNADPVCKFDGENHYTGECTNYCTAEERIKVCSDKHFCKRCLNAGHTIKDCRFPKDCFYCKGKFHHSALCYKKFGATRSKNTKVNMITSAPEHDGSTVTPPDENKPINVTTTLASKEIDSTVLPIIEIPVGSPKSTMLQQSPVLMDSGSMASYITYECAEKLKLPVVNHETLNIETFNCTEPLTKNTTVYLLKVQAKNGDNHNLHVYGVDNITKQMTMAKMNKYKDIIFKIVVPDILIGSNYFWQFFKSKRLPSGFYQAETEFGPLICGAGPTVTSTKTTTMTIFSDTMDAIERLEAKVCEMWKLENIGIFDDPGITDREIVDEFFKATAYINEDGRYVVRLPWKTENPDLPDHQDMCFYRLQSLVKKLLAEGKLHILMNVIYDHIKLGFIEYVTPEMDAKCILKHYIPYHCVFKESLTTPVRPVFDCSAKSGKNGSSLNSFLYNGPPNMPNPVGLLLRFRSQLVVVTGDIAKAFMQILLNEVDRDVFRFYVLIDPTKPVTRDNVREARYTRPLFGAGSSPLILEQVIGDKFKKIPDPIAAEILENNWVDNIKLDGKDAATVIHKAQFAKNAFDEIGMDLREFVSNNDDVNKALNSAAPENTKFLGIPWKPKEDMIIIRVPKFDEVSTKRTVLSAIASIYDPCGLICPIILKGKSYIQQLWKRKVGWDQVLKGAEDKTWWKNFKDANENKEISLNRCIIDPDAIENELHVYCDASEVGFSAAAYIRQKLKNGSYISNLLVAKARITDINKTTIPKLELISATIGSSLLAFVHEELKLEFAKSVLWTDSTCVLGWLASAGASHGRFIENRLKHIKERVNIVKHVRTDCNPADIGSRGCDFDELAANKLWWHGPDYLLLDEDKWPVEAVKTVVLDKNVQPGELDEDFSQISDMFNGAKRKGGTTTLKVSAKKAKIEVQISQSLLPIDAEHFKRWKILLGATAAVLFYTKNVWVVGRTYVIKELIMNKCMSYKDPKMIELAEMAIIFNIQSKYPPSDKVKRDLKLPNNCYGLWAMNNRIPVDEEDSELIWIPKCREIELLILDIHTKLHHAGPRHTLNELRSKYWLCTGKVVVNKVLHHDCDHCKKLKLKPYLLPPMPDLPFQRTKVANPFKYTGVDYAGPFLHNHNGHQAKIYIILFTCMVTRNIHLEVATSASSEYFLYAFRRFISRRSRPAEIYSDHGTNFVLAKKVIEPYWDTRNDPMLKEFLKTERIEWNYIKEKSPWKGGFYERMIGLMKTTLKHAMGRKLLTYEPFCTLVTEIEMIINSRPITPVDAEYNYDGTNIALKPIDFIVQDHHAYFPPAYEIPDCSYVPMKSNEETLKRKLEIEDPIAFASSSNDGVAAT